MHYKVPSSIGMSMFAISFNAGSYWEKEGTRGTSHFMEHLMCKTYEDLYFKFTELGMDENAYTATNQVTFFCAGLDDCVAELSQTILDRLTKQDNLWSEKQFEIEKKIILQEYHDSFNNQMDGAISNFFRSYYNQCGPIGYREDIENFTYEQSLQTAKEKFSRPSKIIEVGLHSVKYNGEFDTTPLDKTAQFGSYDLHCEKVPKEDQTAICLIYTTPLDISLGSKASLLASCVAEGLESPLYQELREKQGLVYSVWLAHEIIGADIIPLAAAQTSLKNEVKLETEFKKFFDQDMKDVISKERFNLCKKGLLIQKKKGEVLPYRGVWGTLLSDFNHYENIIDFSYKDAIDLANELFCISNFEVAKF